MANNRMFLYSPTDKMAVFIAKRFASGYNPDDIAGRMQCQEVRDWMEEHMGVKMSTDNVTIKYENGESEADELPADVSAIFINDEWVYYHATT